MESRLTIFVFIMISIVVVNVKSQMCAPKLFEAEIRTLQITNTNTGNEVWEYVSRSSIDSIGQRIASTESGSRNGQDYSIQYLYYYPARTLYTIQDGKCSTSNISGNMTLPCVDWDEKHVIDFFTKEYVGDMKNGCPIMGPIQKYKDVISIFAMDMEGGIPLFHGKSGIIDGVPTYRMETYTNLTMGIQDPSVFTPPDNCIQI